MIHYYDIKDLKLVGRSDDETGEDLIYENNKWVFDYECHIIERLLGVEPSEPDDSPYKLGNSDVIATIEEIDENKVAELILKYY